jgi:polar amino acid transport system substrate-binding protein
MKKKKSILVNIFLVFALTLLMGNIIIGQAQEKKVYINGIDPGYPPFAYIDEKGNPAGFDVDCLNWIAQEMAFEVKHQPTAWDGIIPALKAKKIDLIASGMTVTKERSEQVDFTECYWVVHVFVVGRQDSDFNVITAMSTGKNVGVQRGTVQNTWIINELIKKGINLKLKLYDTPFLLVEDLVNGRLDVIVVAEPPITTAIKENKPIKVIGPIGMEDQRYSYAVRKGDKELLDILNAGLKKLKSSDAWDEIKSKWEMWKVGVEG